MKAITYAAMSMMLTLSTCAATAPAFAQESTNKMYTQMLSPVAQLNRTCSTTLVQSKLDKEGDVSTIFLTAKHCTDGSKLHQEVYIPVYKNNRLIREDLYRAVVDREDYRSDLATVKLLDTDTVFGNVATVAEVDVPLVEGEPVWTIGWSAGKSRTMTSGVFGNRESLPFPSPTVETEYFRATSAIVGGNSGGSLFHKNAETENYELIGVTSAGRRDANFMGYYVTIDDIRKFLKIAAPEGFGDKKETKKTPASN